MMPSKPQFVGEKIAFSDAFVEVSRGVKKIKQKDYLPAGDHPIIDQGQDAVSGYACGEEGLFSDVPAIATGGPGAVSSTSASRFLLALTA